MEDLIKQIEKFEDLHNNYELMVSLIKKEKQNEVFDKLNINKKTKRTMR